MRYGCHVINADKDDCSVSGYSIDCPGNCPVVACYNERDHEPGYNYLVREISLEESWWNKVAKITLNSWVKFRGWWSGIPPHVATTVTSYKKKPKWIYHRGQILSLDSS